MWGSPVTESVSSPPCYGLSADNSSSRCPDIIVAMDGNMQHRQYTFVHREMILQWNKTCTFLTSAEIEEASCHVSEARAASRQSVELRPSLSVPDGAIAECEESHRAMKTKGGSKSASNEDTFRSKGLMATVCRHDIPLFLCDMQTPGEQQHYSIAMLTALSRQLPPNASIGLMYDVGCVLD